MAIQRYRVGRKSGNVILDSKGLQVMTVDTISLSGNEAISLAKHICNFLNSEARVLDAGEALKVMYRDIKKGEI